MACARAIISRLVEMGVIPEEYCEEAALELHRELSRRSRRVAQTLAAVASNTQLALRFSGLS